MKRGHPKSRTGRFQSTNKYDGELENILKLTEDEELQQLLGINSTTATPENIQALRIMWKKEKNRIAAKKSREKKANLMLELEKKEVQLSNEVETLKRFLLEYDTIIESLLRYVKYTLHGDWPGSGENLQNRLTGPSPKEPLTDYEKEMYTKLSRCLEYFYHIRNTEGYLCPYPGNGISAHQELSNRLIDEILYTIKGAIGFHDTGKL